jgi:hypothetical protein
MHGLPEAGEPIFIFGTSGAVFNILQLAIEQIQVLGSEKRI